MSGGRCRHQTPSWARLWRKCFRRRNLDYPKATVTSISMDMRLTLLASGKYLTILPVSMLRHPTDKAWLRALPVKFEDTPGSVAAPKVRSSCFSAPAETWPWLSDGKASLGRSHSGAPRWPGLELGAVKRTAQAPSTSFRIPKRLPPLSGPATDGGRAASGSARAPPARAAPA